MYDCYLRSQGRRICVDDNWARLAYRDITGADCNILGSAVINYILLDRRNLCISIRILHFREETPRQPGRKLIVQIGNMTR